MIRCLPLPSPAQLRSLVAPSLDPLALIAKRRSPVFSQSNPSRDRPMHSNGQAEELSALLSVEY